MVAIKLGAMVILIIVLLFNTYSYGSKLLDKHTRCSTILTQMAVFLMLR
jgi:hypothetical protein